MTITLTVREFSLLEETTTLPLLEETKALQPEKIGGVVDADSKKHYYSLITLVVFFVLLFNSNSDHYLPIALLVFYSNFNQVSVS